jgi:hypothetical protein
MKSLAIFSSILALSACSKQQQQQGAEQPEPVVEHVAISERDLADQPRDSRTADPAMSRDPALGTGSTTTRSAPDASQDPSNSNQTSRSELTPAAGSTTGMRRTTEAGTSTATRTTPSPGAAPDNTEVNERDRNAERMTPIDQGNSETDLRITREIRQLLMKDGSLSFTAKNVKVITANGKVTLRGPVKSAQERDAIEAAARRVAGDAQVDNQLEVK